ncbi:UNVERIFIED_CONTAM: hypothetical protein NCL1_47226 [Trichonephila clavipes]
MATSKPFLESTAICFPSGMREEYPVFLGRYNVPSRHPGQPSWISCKTNLGLQSWSAAVEEIYDYIASHTKCNTKKDQRYHSEIFLADNMLYKDQAIEISASCDMWIMINLVVSEDAIVGYNRCHKPQHRFKDALEVSLG